MKKILVLCLAAILCLGLVGCNNKDDVNNDVQKPPVQDNQNQENENLENNDIIDNETNSGEENEIISGDIEVNGELSGETSNENDEPVVENPNENEPTEEEPVADASSATGMMTKLMTAANVMVNAPMQDVIPAEMSETYIGLTEEDFNANVADSVFYESMISPANQSFCIVKVKDASKVDELKQKIFDNCNPRKWICMSAERVVVMNSGEYIMLAMASQDSCNSLIPAFKAEFGEANVGTILDKTVSESIENVEDLPGGGMAL